ncbi:AAA family ATPase [Rhizobium sp. CNPSo 3464]|uniref:AAA family ATPase n=1 Tax=Rhizobium sp. CNPSo 3464 TaxID=3021406 RepID=UPI00254AD63E|nr:AAA family ATPase [Rhizobium sp. CNPSo 3464]MDK4737795.1 AAA family ATPase [Rhizobium sp. CNPSo 3464]
MYVSHIGIKNFRALSDINVDLSPHINVIVGPNGVGKTTILQAVRLAKALAAPRTQNEAAQVLISLSAASPHFPQRLFLDGLARDHSQIVEIRTTYTLTAEEIAGCESSILPITQNFVAARLGLNFANPAQLLQFMQSPEGVETSKRVSEDLRNLFRRLKTDPTLLVGISFQPATGELRVIDPIAGVVLAFLDQRLPPSQSIFSYFPADRALPVGETNLQLGGPDAQQQLEMHNSQPQLKYQRLKNLIINAMVLEGTEDGTNTVKQEFETIFTELLKGRRIESIRVNDLGLLSVMTRELTTERLIELDSLSSGEKNIALTFLIVAKSLAPHGIALFDEPELHLNPAVSRDLLTFMLRQYSKPRGVQFLMCSHSPEILSGAFSNDECALLHLKSPTDITRVSKAARHEYAEALNRLGTSVSESLLYQGTILVEGTTDVRFLEIAFPDYARRFKIKDRGGRREVEKTISELQSLEIQGQKVAPIYLIFDRDEEITTLKSSNAVRVLQWKRRSIENYMMGADVLSEILRNEDLTKNTIESAGEVNNLVREIAFEQLDAIVAREVYNSYGFQNSSLQKDDLAESGSDAIATKLSERWVAARASMPEISPVEWKIEFLHKCSRRRDELRLQWDAKWRELCDGKKLLSDLYRRLQLKRSEANFYDVIARTMRDLESEDWAIVRGQLEELIQS